MKVVIVEDEQASARHLKRMLEKQGMEVLCLLHSVSTAVLWFNSHPAPQLIFLDIQLSDGLSFEIFEKTSISSAIIFTTAYDEYALQAFKLNRIDYLLKPIDTTELEQAVTKYKNTQGVLPSRTFDFEDIKTMLFADRTLYKQRFTAQVGTHIKILQVPDIVCFYSENKGSYALMENGRSYLLSQTIEALQNELDPATFFRISRKCILQLKHIKDIVSYSNARLEVKILQENTIDLIVSRERVKDFKLWIS